MKKLRIDGDAALEIYAQAMERSSSRDKIVMAYDLPIITVVRQEKNGKESYYHSEVVFAVDIHHENDCIFIGLENPKKKWIGNTTQIKLFLLDIYGKLEPADQYLEGLGEYIIFRLNKMNGFA